MLKVHSMSSIEDRKQNFIQKAREVHSNKYDYSEVEYVSTKKPVKIICPIHGPFTQCPGDHLKGWGCSKCSGKHKPTREEWIERANKKHNFKYDYSKVEYENNRTPICIICPEHGEFWQTPSSHLRGEGGCKSCLSINKWKRQHKSTEQFITDANKIHHYIYDYSKVEYYNKITKICIICSKHGEFWQTPFSHLLGNGCPQCKNKNQTILYNILKSEFKNETILYEYSPSWLGKQRFDIYFPDYNVAVEYDGQQHFVPIEYFGGKVNYIKTKERDKLKDKLAIENKCQLFRIQYNYAIDQLNQLITFIRNSIIKGNSNLKVVYLYNSKDLDPEYINSPN